MSASIVKLEELTNGYEREIVPSCMSTDCLSGNFHQLLSLTGIQKLTFLESSSTARADYTLARSSSSKITLSHINRDNRKNRSKDLFIHQPSLSPLRPAFHDDQTDTHPSFLFINITSDYCMTTSFRFFDEVELSFIIMVGSEGSSGNALNR
jgi:hypothetical protein